MHHLDPILIELKESVIGNFWSPSPKGEMGYLDKKVDYVFRMLIV